MQDIFQLDQYAFETNKRKLQWELALPNTPEVRAHFQDEEIEDLLFVVTYQGRTLEWPE